MVEVRINGSPRVVDSEGSIGAGSLLIRIPVSANGIREVLSSCVDGGRDYRAAYVDDVRAGDSLYTVWKLYRVIGPESYVTHQN